MDQVHAVCRRRHLSPRTEEAYRYWIRQFIFFHCKRHPRELREAEVTQFLNHLAVQRNVAASTQTQALNAIVFLYRDVLVVPLGEMGGLNRVQQRMRIPVVMTANEVSAVLSRMTASAHYASCNCMPMAERVERALHRYLMHLNENIRRRPNLSPGSSCFRLLCVGRGGKAGASLVGIYRPPPYSTPFAGLCQK